MGDDDFLARWSRRKRAVAEEVPVESAVVPPTRKDIEPETEAEEAELLARLKLPVPETLKPGDDFSAFMAEGVPAFLRKRALRVLWRSNPVLANLDGLNDYDEDFTSPELTQKVLATAYRVGRGIVTEMSSEDESEEAVEETEDTTALSDQEDENPGTITENRIGWEPVEPEDSPDPAPRPRRMRFES